MTDRIASLTLTVAMVMVALFAVRIAIAMPITTLVLIWAGVVIYHTLIRRT